MQGIPCTMTEENTQTGGSMPGQPTLDLEFWLDAWRRFHEEKDGHTTVVTIVRADELGRNNARKLRDTISKSARKHGVGMIPQMYKVGPRNWEFTLEDDMNWGMTEPRLFIGPVRV